LIALDHTLDFDLEHLGFSAFFADQFDRLAQTRPGLVPARIVADGRGSYHLMGRRAAIGEPSGRLRGMLEGTTRLAVGDWVAVADDAERAIIHDLLARKTLLRRRAAGGEGGQVIAANVDVVAIVTSANRDLNPRRIERYLSAVWDSGATPLIVLNKVDLVDDPEPWRDIIAGVALAVPIVQVSALTGEGMDALTRFGGAGVTLGLVGSSGVGKSSLANRLLGQTAQDVKAIREDDARGRHTTTRRELLPLPGGGLLIDTPGMRELGLLDDLGGIDATFADIAQVALECRFGDCRHEAEPGCAVKTALAAGTISQARWESYRKLQREIAALEARRDPALAANTKRRWKTIHKAMRTHPKADRWR
jgi:ribosome biogenesis GTPase